MTDAKHTPGLVAYKDALKKLEHERVMQCAMPGYKADHEAWCVGVECGEHGTTFFADCGIHEDSEANARFIVRACNSHEQLLEALEELTGLFDDWLEGKYVPDSFTTQPARAAIAAAKGGQAND